MIKQEEIDLDLKPTMVNIWNISKDRYKLGRIGWFLSDLLLRFLFAVVYKHILETAK